MSHSLLLLSQEKFPLLSSHIAFLLHLLLKGLLPVFTEGYSHLFLCLSSSFLLSVIVLFSLADSLIDFYYLLHLRAHDSLCEVVLSLPHHLVLPYELIFILLFVLKFPLNAILHVVNFFLNLPCSNNSLNIILLVLLV